MHYPVLGLHYPSKGGLLVAGRALNGWDILFSIVNINRNFIKRTIEYSKEVDGKCSLEWVMKNENVEDNENHREQISKSSFWQATRDITNGLFGNNDGMEWHNHIAWTNLYKIAPHEGGNPSNKEANAQWPHVKQLFEMEVQQFKPKYLLLMTDKSWSIDFIGTLAPYHDRKGKKGAFVQQTGHYLGVKTVVTTRPEGKVIEDFAEEVVRGFG
jgi:hypothetical protein